MRKVALKLPCWLLCVVLVIEWSGAAAWGPSPAQAGKSVEPSAPARPRLAVPTPAELTTGGAPVLPTPQPMPVSLDVLGARSEAIVRAVPRVRYDMTARAQTLGSGVEPAFLFVRDRVRFEAYPGVLRGAAGTYAARAGNAFDRSLLLAEFLKRKGVRTRFALGRLPRREAERLFTRVFEPRAPLEADAVVAAPPTRSPEAEAFEARLRARAVRDYAAIRKALGDTLPSKASPSREEVLREIEGHVWVQAEVNGRWVDLDSVFAEAGPDRTYAAVERTFEALPKEAHQHVTVRVIVETLTERSLKTDTALEFTAAAESLLDRQIFLTHVPGGGGGLGGAITGGIMGRDAWTPVLWVDGETHLGKPVAFAEGQAPVERGRPPRGGLGGLFGTGGALGAPTEFVAEWLEFVVRFPDGRHDVTRRMLVDRAGTAWRQAGTFDRSALRPLPQDANGLTPPRDLHNIWFSAGPHNLAAYADAIRFLALWSRAAAQPAASAPRQAGDPRGPSDPTFGEQVWPFAMVNFGFVVRSDHTILPALNDSPSHRLYADSPRIVIVSLGVVPHAGGGTSHSVQYDLRRDHLRGVARDARGEAGIIERKIWFGALQGALEHETVAQYALAGSGDVSAVTSTSSLLTGEGAVAFRPGAAGRPLVADRETAVQLDQALANRAVLVVPRSVLRGGASGWWEIDPDGTTRAVLAHGTNGSITQIGPRSPGEVTRKIPKPFPGQPPPEGPMGPGGAKKGKGGGGGPEYTGVIKDVSVPIVVLTLTTGKPILDLAFYGAGLFIFGLILGGFFD